LLGSGSSEIEFKNAIILALSFIFLNPANDIEFPGAYFFGLFNQRFKSCTVQDPPKELKDEEYENPSTLAFGALTIFHNEGPTLLPPVLLRLWQEVHFLDNFAPASIDARASSSSKDNFGA